jgi:hypothetical protein
VERVLADSWRGETWAFCDGIAFAVMRLLLDGDANYRGQSFSVLNDGGIRRQVIIIGGRTEEHKL